MLRQRHLHLYRVLWANAFHRPGRRPICDLPQAKLALALDCDVRTVKRLLADLRQPGADLRHPNAAPAGQRVAYVTVYPAERRPGGRPGGRGAGGGRLLVGNRYILNVPLEAIEARVAGDCYHPAEAGALVAAVAERLTSPEVKAHMPSSYRRDIPDRPVSAGHTEGTPEAMSLDTRGGREIGGTSSNRGDHEPGGAPAAQPPPRPGQPGYQQWEDKRREGFEAALRRLAAERGVPWEG